jgi:hypothetical protein
MSTRLDQESSAVAGSGPGIVNPLRRCPLLRGARVSVGMDTVMIVISPVIATALPDLAQLRQMAYWGITYGYHEL